MEPRAGKSKDGGAGAQQRQLWGTIYGMRRLVLVCALVATAAWGQQARSVRPNSTTLTAIHVIGSQRYGAPELVKATGLTIGQAAGEAEMRAGADRLASTGMFGDVTFSYIAMPEGTKVEYKVEDTKELLPAHFDNFVWLPPPELIAQLQTMEPLFRGEVPNAGEMYLRLGADVKAILAKLGVNAEVNVFPQSPPQGGSVVGFLYSVQGVPIPIRSIKFPGSSPEIEAVLQKTAQGSILGKDFSMSGVEANARYGLLPQYRMRGFLRAKFATPAARLQRPGSSDVEVTLPVSEGLMYTLAGMNWSGNTAYAAGELRKQVRVADGQAANQVEIEEELGGISKIYGTRGYMRARLEPQYAFDDAARKVTINVNVFEGDQYRMGDLAFEGLAPNAADALRKLWKLRTGDVYDSSYPQLFFATAARQFDLSHLSIQIEQAEQAESKTVNVRLHFAPKAAQ